MQARRLIAFSPVLALAWPNLALAKDTSYKATVDVRRDGGARCDAAQECTLNGFVFEDRNRDGRRQWSERGVRGVLVSNGLEVVATDALGRYQLPVRPQPGGTTVFITKPADYDVPVNDDNVPQFFYHHVPEGSPPLRFGGLPATGPLPREINFPLIRGDRKNRFSIVVSGDTQPYSNNEIGYVRDTLARDIVAMGTSDVELVMIEGDVVGDDLGLFPRFKKVMSVTDSPLYFVGGNHDLDFDAKDDAYSFDTYRREWGPSYYSFDIGKVHFVGLDNVRYPCTPADNADGRHSFCNDPVNRPAYNGVISDQQMEWLKNDLALVPTDRLIVLNMHIPLLTYIDQGSSQHQTDNVRAVWALLEGRKALALSGHTHTLEQLRPGELYEGWNRAFQLRPGELYEGWNRAFSEPTGPLPFPHIVTGAACGSWWSGDFADDGAPASYQRLGAPRGYLIFEFDGNEYRDIFKATGKPIDKQMSLSFLSPTFTDWYETLLGWLQSDPATRSPITPVSINDLPDTSIVTAGDLAGGTKLVANVWNGSRDSEVYAQIDQEAVLPMERTQQGEGEGFNIVPDPFALERQLYVLRYAIQSESGDARAQGFELFRGSRFEGPPQPIQAGNLTNRSTHLWTIDLPPNLAPGAHTATVITVDVHGHEFRDVIAFEIMDERPPPYFRTEVFQ